MSVLRPFALVTGNFVSTPCLFFTVESSVTKKDFSKLVLLQIVFLRKISFSNCLKGEVRQKYLISASPLDRFSFLRPVPSYRSASIYFTFLIIVQQLLYFLLTCPFRSSLNPKLILTFGTRSLLPLPQWNRQSSILLTIDKVDTNRTYQKFVYFTFTWQSGVSLR